MKKYLLIFLLLGIIFSSCQKQMANETDAFAMPEYATIKYPFLKEVKEVTGFSENSVSERTESIESVEDFFIEIYFRWDECFRPLGICIIISLSTEKSANSTLADPTHGRALVKVEEGKVYLKPDRRIYFSNGTVPVSQDVDLGSDVAKKFGYSSVIIKKGLYKMNFENDKVNGEVYLEALTTK